MLVTFDHIRGFGKMTNQDFIYSNPEGVLEKKDSPDEVLKKGWIPWKGKWYNHRSVRINLENYSPGKTTKKDFKKVTCAFKSISEFNDFNIARKIYDIYCIKNNFTKTTLIEDIVKEASCFFEFKYLNQTRGYTFSTLYKESMVSLEFIQDFSCPNISLGFISQHYECLNAQSLGKKYVYILGGYENACIYKSKFHGMEWWTGESWSKDTNMFVKLCQRDDNIKIENHDNNF